MLLIPVPLLLSLAPGLPQAVQGPGALPAVEAPADCEHCGMDRTAFARARMRVVYAEGSAVGTCSLHCMAEELRRAGSREVRELLVGDHRPPHRLLDARTAAWVLGGRERGVMTPLPKWAFPDRAAAEAFRRRNGGRRATFDRALALARKELGR